LVGLWQSSVLQSLITIRADSAQIAWAIVSAFGLVLDVAHREADFAFWLERVLIARADAAHLAGISVSFENEGLRFLRYAAGECRAAFICEQQILTGFQVSAVLVRKNLVTLLVTKFANTAAPFRLPSRNFLQLSQLRCDRCSRSAIRESVLRLFCNKTTVQAPHAFMALVANRPSHQRVSSTWSETEDNGFRWTGLPIVTNYSSTHFAKGRASEVVTGHIKC
jgi:hypothetical protein